MSTDPAGYRPLEGGTESTHTLDVVLRRPSTEPEPTYDAVLHEGYQDGAIAQALDEQQKYLTPTPDQVQAMQAEQAKEGGAPAPSMATQAEAGMPVDINAPLTPEEQQQATAQLGQTRAPGTLAPTPAMPMPPQPAEDFARSIGGGFVGAAKSLLAAPEAFGLVGDDAPAGQALQRARQTLGDLENRLSPDDPTIVDRFGKAIGSAAFAFVPGLTTAKLVQRAALMAKSFTSAAGIAGSGASTAIEAAQEMGDVYDTLKTLVGTREAGRRAQDVFGKNLALIYLTNRLGPFADVGRGAVRYLAGGLLEGAQEWMQYDISQKQFWMPQDAPMAEQVKQLGWVEEGDRLVAPVRIKDQAEAALFGLVLGGGMRAATGAALEQEGGSLREMLTLQPQEQAVLLGAMGGPGAVAGTTQGQPTPEQLAGVPPGFDLTRLGERTPDGRILGLQPGATVRLVDGSTVQLNPISLGFSAHDQSVMLADGNMVQTSAIVAFTNTPTGATQPSMVMVRPPEPSQEGQPGPEQLGLGGIPQQTTFTLPAELARAQPRMNKTVLDFASSMDKALYILANPTQKSAADAQYLQAVMDWTHQPERAVREMARDRRAQILRYATTRGTTGQDVLSIPDMTTTAQAAPPGAAPGAMPTEQMAMPIAGRDLGEMQGMPHLDASTVQALRDFLKMSASEGMQIEGKPLEINYAHIQTDEGVKRVLAAVSEIYLDEVAKVRQPITQEETAANARAMGMTISEFLNTPREQLVSRKKARLAREMAVASANQLKIASTMFQHGTLPAGDMLRVFATHVAIQTQFARLANEAGGALSTFAADVEGDLSSLRGFETVMEYLGGKYTPEGLATLIDALPTQEQLTLFMEQAPKATAKQMLLEAWYGAMFTGVTLFKNLVGNTAMFGEGYLNRAIAARLPGQQLGLQEALHRTQLAAQKGLTLEQKQRGMADRAALFERDIVRGEANAFAAGAWHSMAEAWAAAQLAFSLGEQQTGEGKLTAAQGPEQTLASGGRVHTPAITGANVQQLESVSGTLMRGGPVGSLLARIPGFQKLEGSAWDGLGIVARAVSRGLIATDEFAKVMSKRGELAALAWRKATLDGLVGDKTRAEVLAEMDDFITNPPETAELLADQRAAEHTLTRPLKDLGAFGMAAGGIDDAAQYSLTWRFFAPFIRISTNAAYWNLERFPLTAPILHQVQEDMRAGGARAKMAEAKMITGTMATLFVAGLAWWGFLRGQGGDDPEERLLRESTGEKPYTFNIPGTIIQIPFKPVEPFGQFLGTVTDWVKGISKVMDDPTQLSEWTQALGALIPAAGKNVFNQTWTRNFSEMAALLFDNPKNPADLDSKVQRFINTLARLPVPGVVRQIETILDPQVAEVQSFMDALKAGIPGVQKEGQLDYWADPREVSTTGLGLELWNPFIPSVDKSLQYGPPTLRGMQEALDNRDLDKLKVWVGEEILASDIPVSRPSAIMLAKQRGNRPQDAPVRLRPDALNNLRRMFAKDIEVGGKTLVEMLATQMLKDEYLQGTSGPNGSRALQIQAIEHAFKEAAKAKFLLDNAEPETPYHHVQQDYADKQQARMGYRYNIKIGQ